jgi:outer membrane protein OmpA-like peptidoglycan-associated protein/tetratricopeptide (TPR) repeat protein
MKAKFLLIILVLSSSITFAQSKVADKFFENYAYVRASELYEEAVSNGDDSEHVLTRLGDCYYNNSNAAQAAKWYKRAIDMYPDINPEYLYKYSIVQRSLGNHDDANIWLQEFQNKRAEDSRSSIPINITLIEELSSIEKVYVEVTNLDINTEYSDFGSFVHDDVLYFASGRNVSETGSSKKYDWNEEPFLDLYQVDVTNNNGLKSYGKEAFIRADRVNTDLHEASVAITNDGKTIYFTRDNVNKRNRKSFDKEGTTHLKIYKASLNGSAWADIEELPFNGESFSTGHPVLSPDNKTLYFVSDRTDYQNFGQTDIFKVSINEDGSFGEPENLGANVNTEGREMFPYVAKDNTLYFSSDGYLNLGLLDIYKSDALNGGNNKPKNMGAPYNSGADDFAYFVNAEDGTGYFSSNREGGKGNDDIYSFAKYECKQSVTGIARDAETQEPLASVTIEIIDDAGKIIETVVTGDDGSYAYEIECNTAYTIRGSKPDYKDDVQKMISNSEHNFKHNVDLNLIPLLKPDQIVINPIFFDFDKWNIRTDAQYELENVVSVMREHPTMVIKIESHTDSRGSDRYNMKLSERRAKSTRDYLLSRNIAPERIESAIGYGESQLLNECSNGVPCSKEKHQLNRRSYFYIVKY